MAQLPSVRLVVYHLEPLVQTGHNEQVAPLKDWPFPCLAGQNWVGDGDGVECCYIVVLAGWVVVCRPPEVEHPTALAACLASPQRHLPAFRAARRVDEDTLLWNANSAVQMLFFAKLSGWVYLLCLSVWPCLGTNPNLWASRIWLGVFCTVKTRLEPLDGGNRGWVGSWNETGAQNGCSGTLSLPWQSGGHSEFTGSRMQSRVGFVGCWIGRSKPCLWVWRGSLALPCTDSKAGVVSPCSLYLHENTTGLHWRCLSGRKWCKLKHGSTGELDAFICDLWQGRLEGGSRPCVFFGHTTEIWLEVEDSCGGGAGGGNGGGGNGGGGSGVCVGGGTGYSNGATAETCTMACLFRVAKKEAARQSTKTAETRVRRIVQTTSTGWIRSIQPRWGTEMVSSSISIWW